MQDTQGGHPDRRRAPWAVKKPSRAQVRAQEQIPRGVELTVGELGGDCGHRPQHETGEHTRQKRRAQLPETRRAKAKRDEFVSSSTRASSLVASGSGSSRSAEDAHPPAQTFRRAAIRIAKPIRITTTDVIRRRSTKSNRRLGREPRGDGEGPRGGSLGVARGGGPAFDVVEGRRARRDGGGRRGGASPRAASALVSVAVEENAAAEEGRGAAADALKQRRAAWGGRGGVGGERAAVSA